MLLIRRHALIVIFSIVAVLFACKDKHDKLSSISISQIVSDIAKENVLMGAAVGIAGTRPEQWDRFEALRARASNKELLALTNDANAVVRCYAFQALADRNTKNLFPLVTQHLSDTATVHTLYGCLGGSRKVGDIFLETVTEKRGGGRHFQLTNKQKLIIDSLLLFDSNNKSEAKDELLSEIKPLEKYYKRIREIATAEKNKIAVVALSKYKRQQDKPLIYELLKDVNDQTYGFAAVINFPDPSFFPFLQQTLRNEISKNNSGNDHRLELLYEAIVQYRDQPSRQLLHSAQHDARDMQSIYHYDYLYQALKKYPAAVYDGLLKPTDLGIPKEKSGT